MATLSLEATAAIAAHDAAAKPQAPAVTDATKPTSKPAKVQAGKAKAQATRQRNKATKAAKAAAATAAAAKVVQPGCASAKLAIAKPTAAMEMRIASIGKHPGTALRKKRWASYRKGMSLAHCRATGGLDHLDIGFYVDHKLMTLRPATKAEMAAAVRAWQAKVDDTTKANKVDAKGS